MVPDTGVTIVSLRTNATPTMSHSPRRSLDHGVPMWHDHIARDKISIHSHVCIAHDQTFGGGWPWPSSKPQIILAQFDVLSFGRPGRPIEPSMS